MCKQDQMEKIFTLIEENQRLLQRTVDLLSKPAETDKIGDWMTVNEAAIILNVTPQTIRSWIHGGMLKYRQVSPRKYLVYRPSLADKKV